MLVDLPDHVCRPTYWWIDTEICKMLASYWALLAELLTVGRPRLLYCWWTCTLLAVIIIHAVGSRPADYCRQIWSTDCQQTDLHALSAGLFTLGLCVVADQHLPAPEVRSGSPGGQAYCQRSGEGTGWSASLCCSRSWQRWNWVFQGE